jgi:hypothetical protein
MVTQKNQLKLITLVTKWRSMIKVNLSLSTVIGIEKKKMMFLMDKAGELLERVAAAEATIFTLMNEKQKEFIEFVLSKYVETGVGELDQTKLPVLLSSMFQSQQDGIAELGGDVTKIRNLFIEFQQHLYQTA